MVESANSSSSGVVLSELPNGGMLDKTGAYLEQVAIDSFKRQVDLDESVWRSLPFFSATLAFSGTVISHASTNLDPLSGDAYSYFVYFLLATAATSLGWSIRWLWLAIWPREYEYPTGADLVSDYAAQLKDYHQARGLNGEALDDILRSDLRSFMTEQYASAARTNFVNNTRKIQARGQALLFMMAGLVLAFFCETAIFVQRSSQHNMTDKHEAGYAGRSQATGTERQTKDTKAPSTNSRDGRGELFQIPQRPKDQAKAMSDENSRPQPAKEPERPNPPPPEILKKNHDGPIEKR